jgi:hypothetical protein
MVIVTFLLLYCCLVCRAFGFLTPSPRAAKIVASTTTSLPSSNLPPTPLPYFVTTTSDRKPTICGGADVISTIGERNGLDNEYPWRFEGRFIFRPSLVRINDAQPPPPPSARLLSLFGYSLGGTVVLEYDLSPVGPYREYVTMGGVVGLGSVDIGNNNSPEERTLGIGQWGTNLYVSTQVAEDVCQYVWGVPAQLANIEFEERGNTLDDYEPSSVSEDGTNGEGKRMFRLGGWGNTRLLNRDAMPTKRYGKIPIYWTPTIKALWAPLLFPGGIGGVDKPMERMKLLPLHKLRLSASAIRLKRCRRRVNSNHQNEIPLGFALVVDDVLIEIGERITSK